MRDSVAPAAGIERLTLRMALPVPVSNDNLMDDYSRAVTRAVDIVAPSVVSIEVSKKETRRRGGPDSAAAAGSGFVFASDGLILTNSHVVEGSAKVQVALPDGRDYAADVIGQDPDTDVAVLRKHAPHLLPGALGGFARLASRA